MYRSLEEEASLMHHILTEMMRHDEEAARHNGKKWKLPPYGQPISLFSGGTGPQRMMKPQDDSELSVLLSFFCLFPTLFQPFSPYSCVFSLSAETIWIVGFL